MVQTCVNSVLSDMSKVEDIPIVQNRRRDVSQMKVWTVISKRSTMEIQTCKRKLFHMVDTTNIKTDSVFVSLQDENI